MKLIINEKAVKWFKEEVGVQRGEAIRFYPQIYGSSPVQENFSLAFSKDDPIDRGASAEMEGILFFIEDTDLWFFVGHDLHIDFNQKEELLKFEYIKP